MRYVRSKKSRMWYNYRTYGEPKTKITKGGTYLFPLFTSDTCSHFIHLNSEIKNWSKEFKEISEKEFYKGKSKRDIVSMKFIIELVESSVSDLYHLDDNELNSDLNIIMALEIYKKLNWNGKST